MIHNIFEFGDKEAKDIMTHRKNLIAIDGELSYNDAAPFIIENNKSRYPVYLEDIDILSVFYILKTHLLSHRKMRYSVLPSKTLRG